MTEMRSRHEGIHEHHFPCDCAAWHYIEVRIDDSEPRFCLLDIADVTHPKRWRDRLKAATDAIRGKQHYHRGILLDEQNATDLRRVLNELLREDG